jgi:glycosyltransferase involved in cell wall biosynthesis
VKIAIGHAGQLGGEGGHQTTVVSETATTQRLPEMVGVRNEHFETDSQSRLTRSFATARSCASKIEEIAHTGVLNREVEIARELGVSPYVEFLGTLAPQQLAERYRKAHCLIFPSRIEGFGIPVVEAMVYGCPVVACNTTAISEVVADAGILIEIGDAQGFADAALRLFEERALREKLVHAGIQRASLFCWSHSAEQMFNAIASVLGRGD